MAELKHDESCIEGRNPVMEALKSGTNIDKIYMLKGDSQGSVIKIRRMAQEKRIPIVEVDRRKLDEMSVSHSHQGVIAKVSPVEMDLDTCAVIFFFNKSTSSPSLVYNPLLILESNCTAVTIAS